MTIPETNDNPFKWKQFSHDIILWSVRWYCQLAFTYRGIGYDDGGKEVSLQSTPRS